ncbi:hypothetical protein [Humibacter ginsenosidimutans]|uniref:Cytochrome c oxidase assembly protein n=1 Tax=Humibacter ginsenosidimutans TaxID=2599293 RepID=A0A5B8M7R1_9MICO|nr:hypothetical protein [Humibacter ginsenosidimutans]QDZ15705.1 hypothetical protein FPZ11_13905 [Humibacter ginsenosidimutans]
MGSYTFLGLPLHILLVHVVVVLVPLTAIAVLLHGLWPAAARRLGFVTPLAALVVLVLTPITVNAGQALETEVPVTAAVQQHADLGQTLLGWVIPLFVVAVVEWVWTRWGERMLGARITPSAVLGIRLLIGIAAVVVAVGVVIDVVLIGDAGARAVWGHLANVG